MVWLAVAAIGFLLLPFPFLGQLRFDFDLKGYLPEDNPFIQFEQRFGTDYDFFVITVPWPDGPKKLKRLHDTQSILAKLATFPHVERVQGLANLELPVFQAGQWQKKTWLRNARSQEDLKKWLISNAPWQQNLVSTDGQHLALWVHTTSGISKKKSDLLLARVKGFIAEQPIKGCKIIGKIQIQEVYFNQLPSEMTWLLFFGSVLIFLLLFIAVRHIQLALFWMLGVGLPSLTLLGIMGWSGTPINALSMIIPLILAVIGLTDLLHLHLAFQSASSKERLSRWKESFKLAGVPALLTSLTTALGFVSLYLIPVEAVAQFGAWTAFGILITGIWVVLVHLGTSLFLSAHQLPLPTFGHVLGRQKVRRWMLGMSCVLSLGLFFIKSDHFLMQELPEKHSTMQDFAWFEQHFGGIRPLEALVQSMSWKNQQDMLLLEQTQEKLQHHFNATPLHSVVPALKLLHMGLRGGQPRFYLLPTDQTTWRVLIQEAEKLGFENEMVQQGWMSQDGWYRLSGRLKDLGARTYLAQWKSWSTQTGMMPNTLTGSAHQMDQSLSLITKNLALGLGMSVLTIGLIFGFLVRSIRLTLLALIVNLFPLACVGGMMGWANIPLQISNILFFNILLGIAVDDSLHILWKAYPLLRQGKHPKIAIEKAIASTENALQWSTLVLMAGFFPLCFSMFSSPQNLGLSMCLGLMAAWWADLHLLPWLVGRFFPSKNASASSNPLGAGALNHD